MSAAKKVTCASSVSDTVEWHLVQTNSSEGHSLMLRAIGQALGLLSFHTGGRTCWCGPSPAREDGGEALVGRHMLQCVWLLQFFEQLRSAEAKSTWRYKSQHSSVLTLTGWCMFGCSSSLLYHWHAFSMLKYLNIYYAYMHIYCTFVFYQTKVFQC